MIIDYVGVKEINGSLIVMDGVKGVSNEEIVDIRLDNGTMRQGRVVQIEGERIVVQVKHKRLVKCFGTINNANCLIG